MVDIAQESFVATSLFFTHVKSDQERAAREWKQTFVDVKRDLDLNYCYRRVMNATTVSQIQSKLWIIEELNNLNIKPDCVALLGGWYGNFLVQLLIDEYDTFLIHNFEIDEDVKSISYKFNKRHKDRKKYKCDILDVMFKTIYEKQSKNRKKFDTIINTSCEHMFHMKRFVDLNGYGLSKPTYVLQSTNSNRYDDHINCVRSAEVLAEQSGLENILYCGSKRLHDDMKRFMVIGD